MDSRKRNRKSQTNSAQFSDFNGKVVLLKTFFIGNMIKLCSLLEKNILRNVLQFIVVMPKNKLEKVILQKHSLINLTVTTEQMSRRYNKRSFGSIKFNFICITFVNHPEG